MTRTVASEGCNSPIIKRPSCRALQHMNKSFHVSESGAICVTRMYECKRNLKKNANLFQQALKDNGVLEMEEQIESVMEEISFANTIEELEMYLKEDDESVRKIHVNSIDMYYEIDKYNCKYEEVECLCNTKYKTIDKKIKPAAVPLPIGSEEKMKAASTELMLRPIEKIGHHFTSETINNLRIGGGEFLLQSEIATFKEMIFRHGKAFAFKAEEIGCVDPTVVTPMVIFTIPHIPWNFKPIAVPRARLPQLLELLKDKVKMKILEPSNAPYSNRWFTVPKKDGSLRFIQDLQPVNKVTIRNAGIGPIVDEFAEAFAGRAIYSMGDLYSGYDQFQLAIDSRNITTMKTPIGLVRMCTLPQGATNSVAHMMNAMNKVLHEYIPKVTMPFLDDIPIKGCLEREKDETIVGNGCRKFVMDHINDCESILNKLEQVHLTLSGTKSSFGQNEVLIVGHMCGWYGRKPSPIKINAIQNMKEVCESVTEVRRFLGACVFYHIWIPHFAHVSDPLYQLLRKGKKFIWTDEHTQVVQQLKETLLKAPVLRQPDYKGEKPIIVTVDTSPIGIGWVINQEDEDQHRYAIRFGAKILNDRQRNYAQVKRELWGLLTALKTDRDYLIGANVVVETDCLPLIGMVESCTTPDIAMLRWIAYIRTMNPELRHIKGKDNPVADMLSRARFINEKVMQTEDKNWATTSHQVAHQVSIKPHDEFNVSIMFKDTEYEGQWLEIGKFLKTQEADPSWSKKQLNEFRKRAFKFFLHEGHLWRHPKRPAGNPLRVICKDDIKKKLITEFHDSLWAGHRGIWATFMKLKEKYWWPHMYKDVMKFVETCEICQRYSTIRYRDELKPTYSSSMHYKWMVDLVTMPLGEGQMRYLVLAREDLTNQVEGRPLRQKTTRAVCKFLLEDVICRYGCVGKIIADRGELDSDEAKEFFSRIGVKLSLTTAYNPEANGKVERGHSPIVKAIVKSCKGKIRDWPRMLPYALWADRTTHSSVTGYMPAELILGQKPIMPVEESIMSWTSIPWREELSREALLALRIQQLERRPEDIELAAQRLKEARLKNKIRFDKTHRIRPKKIEEGDWVLVYDSSLDNQHSTVRKFAQRWFGPYIVRKVYDNFTYKLSELDGTLILNVVAGKRIKVFKKRFELEPSPIDEHEDER